MSGIFGAFVQKDCAPEEDCIKTVYYGTDYHSHLGTEIGGLAFFDDREILYDIKSISLHPFRPQLFNFKERVKKSLKTRMGIGVISDYEPQPKYINSRLGEYAIVHVGKINNLEHLVEEAHKKDVHFSEISGGKVNPTEVVASLVNQGKDFIDGIEIMQNSIEGSSSLMLLTKEGIYVARDKYGRTSLTIAKRKDGSTAVASETCSFPNLGFGAEGYHYLGPGEIGIITEEGYRQMKKPEDKMQICTFLYIYYGFPASYYEGINVETTRNKFGEVLARKDKEAGLKLDFVAGIPDSGTGSAIGYMNEIGLPYRRPYVKYSATWPRSFMPREQEDREFVAKMKLIPIIDLIKGHKILFNEDSIVRGTQLQKKITDLFNYGAEEVHMRPSCSPLMYICKYLNFSRSKSLFDLAARKAMRKVEGREDFEISPFLDEDSEKHEKMVDVIRGDLGLTSLKYPKFKDMISAIGLPGERLCSGCWRESGSCNKS